MAADILRVTISSNSSSKLGILKVARENQMVGLTEIEAIGIIAYFDNTHSGRLHYPE
jgi:hypothetical protein